MNAQELIEALEPMATEHGVELVDVELVGAAKSPTVRVYIDTPGGVSFDDIVGAQAWIDAYLEQEDPFPGAYVLEVSSPGIDRHLRTREHFERFKGSKAHIVTAGIPGRSKWTGVLLGVQGDNVMIDIDGQAQPLPFESIRKAHVVGSVDFSKRKES